MVALDRFDARYIAEKSDRVIADCHPRQRDYVVDDSLWITALVGRGGGKTTGQKARFILRMLRTQRARCVYIATTRVQAEILLWTPLKDTLEKLGFVIGRDVTFNETKLLCTFLRNGARLRLVGADDQREIDKLRGQPFHEVCIDEAASFPAVLLDNLVTRIIGPRLGDYNGTLCMIGTPGHILQGKFYDFTRPGAVTENNEPLHRPYDERDDPQYAEFSGWSSHSWSLNDPEAQKIPALYNLWQRALLNKKNERWSDDHPTWMREYLGIWSADNSENVFKYRPHDADGKPLNQWNPERYGDLKFARLPIGFDWHYVIGMDLGHSDPFALQVLAFAPDDETRSIYQVYEFCQTKMYARPIAELLLGKDRNHDKPSGVLGVTGWPDGMVADLAGLGDTLLDELREVYGIRIAAAEKGYKYKVPAVELCNGDLIDGRIKVLKGSKLEDEMTRLQWVMDEYGKLSENKGQANHCLVAGTMVMTETGERPIEDVKAGEWVWTRSGLRRVTFSGQVGTRETVTIAIPNGRSLTGTPDHRVLTSDGWVPLELVTQYDTFVEWANTDRALSSFSTGKSIDAIQMGPTPACDGTSPHQMGSSFIAPSGHSRMDLLIKGCMSIIEMGTTRTMLYQTSKRSMDASTLAPTCERQRPGQDQASRFANQLNQLRPHGMGAETASSGTASMPLARSFAIVNARVTSAVSNSSLMQPPPNDAVRNASDSHTTHGCANTTQPVFDLTVADDHEFFANGILVSNCTDAFIYARLIIAKLFESGNVIAKPAKTKHSEPDEPTEKTGEGGIEAMLADPEYIDPWDSD